MKECKRQARIEAIKKLYEIGFQDESPNLGAIESHMDSPSFSLFKGTLDHKEAIDRLIEKYSLNWKKNRIALIDLNILRMAIYEILFCKDFESSKIYIDEAIEISKLYGSLDSSKFINGILDSIMKKEERKIDV